MTSLASGERVSKHSDRLEAYGNIDELNAVIGIVRDSMLTTTELQGLDPLLEKIQCELFSLGAEVASTRDMFKKSSQKPIGADATARLESEIDNFDTELEPLKNFILPGGHLSNSFSHLARTVCRRCERLLVKLQETDDIRSEVCIYFNRLSDWLFALSRVASHRLKVDEVIWK